MQEVAHRLVAGSDRDRPRLEALARARAGVRALLVLREVVQGHPRPVGHDGAELGLDGAAALPGWVQNPYPWMKGAGAYVLSSRWEGLPSVLIEALYCGVPIVATDCLSGPREILQDGRIGPLVPIGDAPGMAGAIARMLDDPPPSALLTGSVVKYHAEKVLDNVHAYLTAVSAAPRRASSRPV